MWKFYNDINHIIKTNNQEWKKKELNKPKNNITKQKSK